MSTSEGLPPVLLVAWELSRQGGGQERALVEYADELERRGVEIEVASRKDGLAGRRHHRLEGDSTWSVARLLHEARQVVSAARERCVVQAMIPVAGCHLYVPRGGLYPEAFRRNAASRGAVMQRVVGRGLLFSRRRRDLLRAERALLTASPRPRVVALSEAVRQQARTHYALDGEGDGVHLVRNGVAPRPATSTEAAAARRAALGIAEGDTVFLAAAHNFRLKGIGTLRRAASRLPADAPWRIVIAGGTRRASQGRLIEVGVEDDLDELYALADVLVHPTFYDTCSRVVLEAIARGLPVITTRYDGAGEELGAGGQLLEDPRDAGALGRAMESWLDPERRNAARRAQRGRATQVSMARHVDEMIPVLREAWTCAS